MNGHIEKAKAKKNNVSLSHFDLNSLKNHYHIVISSVNYYS